VNSSPGTGDQKGAGWGGEVRHGTAHRMELTSDQF
jgi:hypothetical protein